MGFFASLYYWGVQSPSLFMQSHYIFTVLIIICIIFIGNIILFSADKNIEDGHFNRNTTEIDGKTKYVSSNFIDSMHYTLTTFSTVGYGDITPKTTTAKVWTMFSHLLVILTTLKLFEHIYVTGVSSKNSLENVINELNSTIAKQEQELRDLKNVSPNNKKSVKWPSLRKLTGFDGNKVSTIQQPNTTNGPSYGEQV